MNKLMKDRKCNPSHRLRIKNATGFLWTGMPKDQKHYNVAFSDKQLPALTRANWSDSCMQRFHDNFLCGASTQKMAEQAQDAIRLVLIEDKTEFFMWKSKTAKIFACQCRECHCVYHYGFYNSSTSTSDRASAICWFLAFMYAHPGGCAPHVTNPSGCVPVTNMLEDITDPESSTPAADVVDDTPDEPVPLCARWGYDLLGQNGIVADENVHEDEGYEIVADENMDEDDEEDPSTN